MINIQKPIIVFDSGKGGTTIYNPLKQLLPNEHIIYIDDHANFPYGNKSATWLSARFIEFAKEWEALNPKLIVLACNTATVNVISLLRSKLNCPAVGVEPVIKPLAPYNPALVLMTSAAAKSATTKKLLAQYGPHIQVYSPPSLAEAIEFNNTEQVKKSLNMIKELVHKHQIKAIGLSCTHYPLIINEFKQAMPNIIIIDPSLAVARQVVRVLRSIEHADI